MCDCRSESILQKTTNLVARGASYNNYYSNNTVKYLVDMAPNGLIMPRQQLLFLGCKHIKALTSLIKPKIKQYII
jgi:hypothetical protein